MAIDGVNVSWDDDIPIYDEKNHPFMFQTTNQYIMFNHFGTKTYRKFSSRWTIPLRIPTPPLVRL